ncbi:MAG TPA: hypothetical protein VIR04_00455, partial [Paralcaligenes sp.]
MSACSDCPYLSRLSPKRAVCCCDEVKAHHLADREALTRELAECKEQQTIEPMNRAARRRAAKLAR